MVKGYKQEWGKDYDETFAPVFAYSTMRTVLSIANQHDLRVDSFNIANAFIQCDLDREHLLMKCPPGLDIRGADGKLFIDCAKRFMVSNNQLECYLKPSKL